MKLFELHEKRASAVAAMRNLADRAETEKRDLNTEEDGRFAALKTEIADLDKKIGRAQALADAERSAPAVLAHGVGDGRYEDRARDFSLVKAIRAAMPTDVGGGSVDIGFEREISQEVTRRSGRQFQGIAVPDEIFRTERRTLLVGSSAADLVPNPHRADLFVDRLRDALVVARLGGTYLDSLTGSPIDIPRATGSSSGQWLAEDDSLTDDDASFDDISFTPKTVGALTSYSRRTLLNSSPAIEQIVRNDLAAVLADAVDAKAMLGDGSGNTPTGVINAGSTDIGVLTPSWGELLAFVAAVEGDNALMGALGWALNPHVVRKLRSTVVASSTDSRMLMTDPGNLVGYAAVSTVALPGDPLGESPSAEGHLIFGDWSSLMIGSWTGIDILINPYESTAYAKGRVLVRAMKDLDVQIRHPESFAFSAHCPTT